MAFTSAWGEGEGPGMKSLHIEQREDCVPPKRHFLLPAGTHRRQRLPRSLVLARDPRDRVNPALVLTAACKSQQGSRGG